MKSKVIIFSLLCLIVASCNYNQPSRRVEMSLEVVKFKDDKYREYILAEEYGDENHARMRGETPPIPEELIVGSTPYSVKLPNGYWVIDWRWRTGWIYPPFNVLLTHKWDELTHWGDIWDAPKDRLSFRQYIIDYAYITRRSIDEQFGLNVGLKTDTELGYLLYWSVGGHWFQLTSERDIPEDERESFYQLVHQQDSLHALYVQRLTELVENGKFSKLCIRPW